MKKEIPKNELHTKYYDSGQKKLETNHKDGMLDGKLTSWYESGQIKSENNYKDGKKDGKWTGWHENGQIAGDATFKDDKCISGDCNPFDSLL